MKRLYISLILLLGFLVSFGQTIPFQAVGNSGNEYRIIGIGSANKGFMLRNSYTDTTEMNTDQWLKYQRGIQVRSGDTIWQRSNDLTRWFKNGSGSINADTSNSILLYGDGSIGNPITGVLQVSGGNGNAVQLLPDGLFVPVGVTNGITQPGVISWVSGYTYEVSPSSFYIAGVNYTTPYTEITLANSDPTYDRYDAVVGNTDGTVTIVTGTPAEDPLYPTIDPSTQVQLGFIFVTANSTEPNVDQDFIYQNYPTIAWTTTSSTARIIVNSTNNPYSVPTDIEASSAQNNDNVIFTAISPPTISDFNIITFKIRSKQTWPNYTRLELQFYSGAFAVGNPVSLSHGVYGFNSTLLTDYQIISIPLTTFGALTSVTAFRITAKSSLNRVTSWYIDDIQLQSGIVPDAGQFFQQLGNTFFANAVLGTKDNFPLTIITNNNEKARITTAGNLLIGTTVDAGGSYKLQTLGGIRINATGAPEITFVGLDTDNSATQVAAKDASGDLVWRDVSTLGGTVTSVGLSMPSAFTVTNSPVTSTGTLTVTGAGTTADYIRGDGSLATFPTTISGITADNGLTANTSTNVQLGGSLLAKTTITTGVYNLRIEGPTAIADSATVVIKNTNSPGTGRGLWVHSASSTSAYFEGFSGIQAVASDGQAVTASATGTGIAISATAVNGGRTADFTYNPSSTNDIANVVTLARTTTGTAANGIGGSLNFVLEASSSQDTSTRLISRWTDATLATRTSEFSITGVNNAGNSATLFTLAGNGALRLNSYGVGTFTGTPAYAIATDASGNLIETSVSASGLVYTASNGLTMTANNTKLGGTLVEATTITGGSFTATFTSTVTGGSNYTLNATNTSTGNAFLGQTSSGTAVTGSATSSGVGVSATSVTGTPLFATANPSSTNTTVSVATLRRSTTGTAADGIGGILNFEVEYDNGSSSTTNEFISKWTTAAAASRVSQLIITGVNSAVTADLFTLSGSGALKLNKYGINTFAGTAAYVLAVDASGNVVEVAAAGAGMSNPLTTNGDLIYGVGSTPTRLPIGTAGQVLTVNAGATAPEWTTVTGTGSVTSVAQSFTGGLISVAGSPITTSGTLALTVAGTSGGIPYFSSASAWASSAALANNAIVIGGGAGAAPETTTTGTGVLTALGVNVGSAGAFVTFDGALGTPSSGVATNLTGTATALNIGGNAATATILQTARTINGTSFDGSTNITVTAAAGTLTGSTLAAGVTASSLTSVGTIATGVWNGTAIGDTYISSATTWNAKQTGDATLTALAGLTITNGSIIYGTGADAFAVLAAGTNGQVLTLAGGVPTWAAAGSGTVTSVAMSVPTFLSVSGSPITGAGTFAVTLSGTALPAANGGTGLTAYGTANQITGMNAGGTALEYKTFSATNGASVTHAANSVVISTVFNPTVQTLTDGATITWNVTNGGNAVVTLAGTGRTLSITNPVAGYTYSIRIIQGSGGSKTITTWPTNTKWPDNGTVITLSTSAGEYDKVNLEYDGVNFYASYQNDYN